MKTVLKTAYDFSSVQCDFPSDISKKIIDWGKENIPDSILSIKPFDSSSGRETNIHVTVKYGIHTKDFSEVQTYLKDRGPFEIVLGNISIFEPGDHDVVKIEVASPDLFDLNKLISEEFETTDTHPKYIPHVTVAYVKKGEGKRFVGRDDFRGTRVMIKEVQFSGKDNRMTTINLSQDTEQPQAIIAVDFDSTIVRHNKDILSTEFEFNPYAKEVLLWMYSKRFFLVLWTVRCGDALKNAVNFLNKNGIRFNSINENAPFIDFDTSRKIYADFYVDDRSLIGPVNWIKIKDTIVDKFL